MASPPSRDGLQHHCVGFLGSPSVMFQLMVLEPGTSPMRPLCCPQNCCDTAARTICQSCSSTELAASHGTLAHLHFRGSLGKYLSPPMYRDNVFLTVHQLSMLASQQPLPSLCSYSSQRQGGSEQGSVSTGGARAVCDAQSPSLHHSPQHGYSEMDFKVSELAEQSHFTVLV